MFVCLGVGSYGLASTEAGATPASLVVISPRLEMYFRTTRCGCASRPSEAEVLLRLASADPERPEERRFAGRGRQTPRWVQDPPTQEESPEETSRLLAGSSDTLLGPALLVYSTPKGLNIRVDAPLGARRPYGLRPSHPYNPTLLQSGREGKRSLA